MKQSRFIRSRHFSEHNDKPCEVELGVRKLDDELTRIDRVVDRCRGKKSENAISIDFPGPNLVSEGLGITGLQVCFSFQSERVKGLRAYTREINRDGSLG